MEERPTSALALPELSEVMAVNSWADDGLFTWIITALWSQISES